MTLRPFALVLCVALGCGRGPTPAPASSPVHEAEAKPPSELTPMATCPEDSAWSGAVCQGHGYVACPAGTHLDDHNRCTSNGRPASADAGATRHDAGRATEDDDDSQ
jgi:hypothetical protein